MTERKTDEREADKPATAVTDAANIETFEVLIEAANGRQAVHTIAATSADDARKQISETLPAGVTIVEVDKPGRGLGSGDIETHQGERLASSEDKPGDDNDKKGGL